jgi:hypothetical protein
MSRAKPFRIRQDEKDPTKIIIEKLPATSIEAPRPGTNQYRLQANSSDGADEIHKFISLPDMIVQQVPGTGPPGGAFLRPIHGQVDLLTPSRFSETTWRKESRKCGKAKVSLITPFHFGFGRVIWTRDKGDERDKGNKV